MLGEEKVDLLEISGGTYENLVFLVRDEPEKRESTRQREAYFLDFAQEVRRVSSIPLMVTGGFQTSAFANEALQRGELDVIGMARPFATHPDLIPAYISGEKTALPRKAIRTGIRSLDDSAEGGYYAWQIIRLAKGKRVKLDISGLRSALFLIGWELGKAVGRWAG
jgi:2,4-dienoyl-CoA reductase-like NADH-dependent reductase (Old Yellow Enzyme family)